MLFDVVAQSLKPVKLFGQQLATFLLFRVHLGVAQQCWAHARSLRIVYKDLRVVSFPRFTAGPNIFGSCCICLYTTANTHATTPNIAGVVASVSTQPNMHQPASEFSSSTYKWSKPLDNARASRPIPCYAVSFRVPCHFSSPVWEVCSQGSCALGACHESAISFVYFNLVRWLLVRKSFQPEVTQARNMTL